MSLPWAARGLKIPYVVRNDWQSRGLASLYRNRTGAPWRDLPARFGKRKKGQWAESALTGKVDLAGERSTR
ncbi:transposase [Streptomyces africanus]|uniref:Transposase n=1 Tax=Streptomyces africanus TaxID=231024 RepID=A0ABU0QF23_9ACTN|nr:hypothetical protein [Streptomyces africanus]MDQ0745989.1 transposase [Streptomyces africanus]